MTGDFDGTAEALYRFAGFQTTAQPPLLTLVERLLGDGSIRTVPDAALRSDGALVRVKGEWRVYLRAGASPLRKRFVLLHELSHWALGPEASEDTCDRLAGALLLPRQAYLNAGPSRERMPRLATMFGSDQTCAWLRFGEATGVPTAVVGPSTVRIRGAAYSWPLDPELRALGTRSRLPGLRKCRLSDDTSRSVVRAI